VALDQIAAAGTAAICSTVASELQRNLRLESTIRQLEQAQGATMKKLLLTSTALVIGGQAFAADLPVKAPRIAAPVAYSWTGCYIGAHVGAGRSRTEFSDPGTTAIGFFGSAPALQQNIAPLGSSIAITGQIGALGGGQVGCDYQFAGNWVIGLAGDFSWANIQGQGVDPFFAGKNGGPLTLTSKTDGLASATGRLGYAFDRLLIYGKGGAAWAHDRYTAQNLPTLNGNFCGTLAALTPCNPSGTATRWGWVVGGGIEWAFVNNWSAFAEYDHYFFGSKTIQLSDVTVSVGAPTAGNFNIKQDIDVVKVGINYRFSVGP